MKKIFIVSLVVIGCMGIFSCASGHRQVDILHPEHAFGPFSPFSLITPMSIARISIEGFNEKEIVFKILLPSSMWLDYVIEDEEGNVISEEAFSHDVRSTIRKMKAKEEYEFRKGENYTLYIGYKSTRWSRYLNRWWPLYSYKFVF